MSFSYLADEGLPNDRDRIRLYIGDSNEATHKLEDEEIDVFLEEEPNRWWAAAAAAEALYMRLEAGYFEDQKVGETRLRAKRVDELKKLVDRLRARGATHQLPSAGGIFQDETDTMLANENIRKGDFSQGMNDYPGTTNKSQPSTEFEA